MVIYSIIVVVAILVAVIFFITRPFFTNEDEMDTIVKMPDAISDEEEYQNILKRIRELDFDFKLGKVTPDDYSNLREELKQQAAECLQRLHEVDAPESAK